MYFYIIRYILVYKKKRNYVVIGLGIYNTRHKNKGFDIDTEVV